MRRFDRGAILITTLWMLTLLTLLAIGVGARAAVEVKIISFFINSRKAHYIAEAGLRKTIFLLEKDVTKTVDSLNEVWSSGYDSVKEQFVLKDIKVGAGAFTIWNEAEKDDAGNTVYLYGASDESAKININEMGGDILANLPGFSTDIASAVVDWRDEDDLPNPAGAESDYYEGLDVPYACKNGRFAVSEELMLVRGITKEVYDGIEDLVTPYGGDKAVNINTAPKEALAVLIGPEFEELPAKITDYRKGSDGIIGTEDDNIFMDINTIGSKLMSALAVNHVELNRIEELKNAGYLKVASNCFRIRSRGEVKNGRIKKTIDAVVERTGNASKFLYYYEL